MIYLEQFLRDNDVTLNHYIALIIEGNNTITCIENKHPSDYIQGAFIWSDANSNVPWTELSEHWQGILADTKPEQVGFKLPTVKLGV